MKYLIAVFIFILYSIVSSGQSTSTTTIINDKYVLVYVDAKKKIILNGEKSNFKKLKKYLQSTNRKQAKLGTVKPTPMNVFPVFERVVQLMKNYEIESKWYSDKKFTIPFFEENNDK